MAMTSAQKQREEEEAYDRFEGGDALHNDSWDWE